MSTQFPLTINRNGDVPLQQQLRRGIISAIHDGRLRNGQKLPSSRALSEQLSLARNTVTAVYDELIARGYLEAIPRRGCFVAQTSLKNQIIEPKESSLDWAKLFLKRPSKLCHIEKPSNWRSSRYPFVFGEVDRALFPFNAWREASRQTLARQALDWSSADHAVHDDPMLIEQIRTLLLPTRGIYARPDEILVTFGSQEGFYLLAQILAGQETKVGYESPGYPDSGYIFEGTGARTVPISIDTEGAVLPKELEIDIAILTPGAQCPTMTLMSDQRRENVLTYAEQNDVLIVEDDHDGLVTISGKPALKSRDTSGRVLYVGSLSKVLAPGVRLGYLVAPAPVIEEARWMRRLIHRFVPLGIQRAAAMFLAEGHFLTLAKQLRTAHLERWHRAMEYLPKHMESFKTPEPCHSGAAIWLKCPPDVDTMSLSIAAQSQGVAFENGNPFVTPEDFGRYLRLGLSVIPADQIESGLRVLGQAANSASCLGTNNDSSLAQSTNRKTY